MHFRPIDRGGAHTRIVSKSTRIGRLGERDGERERNGGALRGRQGGREVDEVIVRERQGVREEGTKEGGRKG